MGVAFGSGLGGGGECDWAGNFLRFPRLAAEYGGGSFLIPYFIALFVLGIPSCGWNGAWGDMEGFLATTRHRDVWKDDEIPMGTIVGSLGVSLPLLFAIYYTYIESWTLAYATFSATGQYYAEDREKLKDELPPEVTASIGSSSWPLSRSRCQNGRADVDSLECLAGIGWRFLKSSTLIAINRFRKPSSVPC